MGNTDTALHGREGAGDRTVHVTDDDDVVRTFVDAYRLEAGHDPRRLLCVGTAPHSQEPRRLRHVEIIEECIGHRRIVVLTCMDDMMFDGIGVSLEGPVDGSDLHEIGSCTHDGEDALHLPSPRRTMFLRDPLMIFVELRVSMTTFALRTIISMSNEL